MNVGVCPFVVNSCPGFLLFLRLLHLVFDLLLFLLRPWPNPNYCSLCLHSVNRVLVCFCLTRFVFVCFVFAWFGTRQVGKASPPSLDKILQTSPPPSQIALSNGTLSHSSGSSDCVPETSVLSYGRRTALPCAAPSGSEAPSLWGILRKNIGKDLSRISMPVTLNEPLGVLQRMCEQLEYSELLDAASKEPDPVERLALLAAFAVSGYGSSFWRTHKPFNPLLGETFECIREDKNFRYIAEQVCIHFPLSRLNFLTIYLLVCCMFFRCAIIRQ